MRSTLALVILAFTVQAATGQALSKPELSSKPGLEVVETSAVTIGKRIELRSKVLDDDVSMNIYLPTSFDVSSEAHTYPVIFVNGGHGTQFFATLAGIVKHLGDRERIPESIVVSLNSMGDIPEIFTHGMWSIETLGGSGDPQAGLRHIEQEVIPYLEDNYRANAYRLLIGVSGSSLFPVYTFTHAPGLFDSHILIAAADILGMGYKKDRTFIDAFEATLTAAPKRKAKLYVGVADSDLEGEKAYRANLDELSSRLKRFDQLDLMVEVVPNADHYAVFIDAMLSAFDQNFPHDKWSARYRELVAQPGEALENIDRYYQKLSKDYGFQILPRADRWNNVNCLRFMTRHLIQEQRPKEAISVAKRRAQYQPGVAASYTGLTDAYEADGQINAAIKALKKAITLAKADRGTRTAQLEDRLKSLEAALP